MLPFGDLFGRERAGDVVNRVPRHLEHPFIWADTVTTRRGEDMSEKRGSQGSTDGDAEWSDDRDGGVRPFIDDVFDVLADWRRREICRFFVDTDADVASVRDLAILVAGCRPATVECRPPGHDELVTSLEQHHLPRLDAAGVVDYDSRSGTVRYRGQPTVEKWLEHVTAVDDRCV
jgi:hypothetical protein